MKSQIELKEGFVFQGSNQGRNVGHPRTARRKRFGFGSQYTKCYMKRLGKLESVVRMRHLAERKGGMKADSSRSEQSTDSRSSCSEDLGSRICGAAIAETSESCSSPEDLAAYERTN